jgi:hypothetical protein
MGLLAVIGFWFCLGGVTVLMLALSVDSPDCVDCAAFVTPLLPLGVGGLAIGTAQVVAWDGLRRHEPWGRRLGSTIAALMLVVLGGAWLWNARDLESILAGGTIFGPAALVYAIILLGVRRTDAQRVA